MNSKDSRKREKGKQRTDGTNSKMRDLKLTISMISIDASGLSSPNEKAEIVRLVKKQDTTLCCLQEMHFNIKANMFKTKDGKRDATIKTEAIQLATQMIKDKTGCS